MDAAGTASPGSAQPEVRWLPSQKGFLVDAPQRQSDALGWLRVSTPVSIFRSPVAIKGPLGAVKAAFGVISVVISLKRGVPPGSV
jgi:hypothetical protein